MPSSSHHHISKMVDWIVRLQPRSVLDIGVGFGKWGFLAREYTDIAELRYGRDEWQVRIDGIEAHEGYRNPVYDHIYDTVFFGDALSLVDELPDYDLAILGDVIEHFEKEDGARLLGALPARTRYILISSPTVFYQQGVPGNPYEAHKSLWSMEDFARFDFDYDEYHQYLFVAVIRGSLISDDAIQLHGRAASKVYSSKWLRGHPKLAHMAKSILSGRG